MLRHHHQRKSNAGVVLFATVLSLILVIGLFLAVNAISLGNTKVWKSLARTHQEHLDRAAVRELIRPIVGEALIAERGDAAVFLNGRPNEITYKGLNFNVKLQADVGAMDIHRARAEAWEVLLPPPFAERLQKPEPPEGGFMSLAQALALAGSEPGEISELSQMFVLTGGQRWPDAKLRHWRLGDAAPQRPVRAGSVRAVTVAIE